MPDDIRPVLPRASRPARLAAFLRSCFDWDRPFLRNMLMIALPLALQELVGASLHIVDGMMVSSLGDAAYSGVNQANRFTFIFQLFLFGMSSGGSIFFSQFWGAKDLRRIRQAMGLTLAMAAGLSMLFSLAGLLFTRQIVACFLLPGESFDLAVRYLRIVAPGYVLAAVSLVYAMVTRAAEKPLLPMIASVSGLLTNTVFNYALIYGKFGFPSMGVEGAAIATALSYAVILVINLAFAYGRRLPAGAKLREMRCRDRAFIRKFFKTALPVVANEGLWGMGFTAFSVFYGRMGDVSVAAVNVTSTISDLVWVLFFSITNAAAILVGKTLGTGDREKAYLYAKRFLAGGVACGLIFGLLLALLRLPLVGLYAGLSQEARDKAQLLLLIASAGLWARAFNCVNVVGVLRSGGDTVFSMILDASTLWLVGVPLVGLAALVFHWPIEYVYLCTLTDEVLKIFISVPRFTSRKWMHVLTGKE